jgi:hypothetical protein
VRIGILVEEVIRHGHGHRIRNLCSAWAVEIGGRLASMDPAEGRELGSNILNGGESHGLRVLPLSLGRGAELHYACPSGLMADP